MQRSSGWRHLTLCLVLFGQTQYQPTSFAQNTERFKQSLVRFCNSSSGLQIRGVGTERSKWSGRDVTTSIEFEISTTSNLSARRFECLQKVIEHDKILSTEELTAIYKENEFALTSSRLRLPDKSVGRNQIDSWVKYFSIGRLQYGTSSFIFGVSDLDGELLTSLVDWGDCRYATKDGAHCVTFNVPSRGLYCLSFSGNQESACLTNLTITKNSNDEIFARRRLKVSDTKIAKNEPKKQIVQEVAFKNFNENGIPFETTVLTKEIGEAGTSIVSVSSFKLIRSTSKSDEELQDEIDSPVNHRRAIDPVHVRALDNVNVTYELRKGKLGKSFDKAASVELQNASKSNHLHEELSSATNIFETNYLRTYSSLQCGLYSLMMAFEKLGVEYKLDELLDEEYVGSKNGSSAAQLISGGKSFWLQCKCSPRSYDVYAEIL